MAQLEKPGGQTALQAAKPRIITCDGLAALEEAIRKAIAYRAYEIYESRGRNLGRDMEDWFNAEKELLKPLNVEMAGTESGLRLRAKVPGFKADDIQLGVSSRRLIIWGQTHARQMLAEIDLPAPVKPDGATATVTNDVLEFQAPREKLRS